MLYPRATPSISDNFQAQSSTCVGGWAFFGLIKYSGRVFHPVPRKMSRTLPPRQSATLSPPSKLFSKQSAPTLPKISDLKKLKKNAGFSKYAFYSLINLCVTSAREPCSGVRFSRTSRQARFDLYSQSPATTHFPRIRACDRR